MRRIGCEISGPENRIFSRRGALDITKQNFAVLGGQYEHFVAICEHHGHTSSGNIEACDLGHGEKRPNSDRFRAACGKEITRFSERHGPDRFALFKLPRLLQGSIVVDSYVSSMYLTLANTVSYRKEPAGRME